MKTGASPTAFFTGGFPFLEWLARRFPYRIQRWIARLFCEAVFWGTCGLRRTIMRNLAAALPETTAAQRRWQAHRILMNYGIYFCDLLALTTAPKLPACEDYFDDFQNLSAIETALASENGALLVTPHLGNWELGVLPLSPWRERLAAVTAPIRAPAMRARMEAFRAQHGIELVTLEKPEEYLFTLKRLLMERRLVALLVDRYVGGHGMPAPFFGRETILPCGYLHLVRMLNAPIIPVFVVRNERGRYSCKAEEPLYVARTDDRDRDIRDALLRVAAVMEQYIRRHLDQWYCFAPLIEPEPHSQKQPS